jgi:hypothetical protein
MVTIRLEGHTVQIDPPQHLAMLEIVRESDGSSVKVLHKTGYETEPIPASSGGHLICQHRSSLVSRGSKCLEFRSSF